MLKRRFKATAKAAAFPAMYLTLQRTKAELAKVKASLAEYEKTTPAAGGRQAASAASSNGKPDWDKAREDRYRKFARPER